MIKSGRRFSRLSIFTILPILLISLGCGSAKLARTDEAHPALPGGHGIFTGEILPVFYVKDVKKSVAFYRDVLGFDFHHYYDYEAAERVTRWEKSEPPIWAEMAARDLEFGLHLTPSPETFQVGGMRHYFLVEDVDAHHRRIKKHDVEDGPMIDRAWMRMFKVIDPDGHETFFATRPADNGT